MTEPLSEMDVGIGIAMILKGGCAQEMVEGKSGINAADSYRK